jgi:hypothetical protein
MQRQRASGATLVYHVAAFAACAYFLWRAEELFGSPHANTLAFGGRCAPYLNLDAPLSVKSPALSFLSPSLLSSMPH